MNLLSLLSRLFRPKALYEAADSRRPHPSWRDGRDGDSTVAYAGERLRRFARHLDQNHDISRGALDRLVQFVVGPNGIGIEPLPKTKTGEIHRPFADDLLAAWNDWTQWPEVTFEHDWIATQRLMARSWLRDGEVLAQVIDGPRPYLDHGTRVPLSLELIEADLLPLDFHDAARGITSGVERDAWGRPRAYHLYKTHPGALANATTGAIFGDLKRVPTDQILHLKLVDRIRQARGVSQFAAVIRRLSDIKQYEDDERIAANIAARMTAYIKKTIPDILPADDSAAEPRRFELSPGMIFDDLRPGEDVGLIDTKRPNPNVEEFRKGQLRAAAAGLGTSYSSLARDYNGTYSAQRQELVEQQGSYELLSALFIGQFVRPIWQRFVQSAIVARIVVPPADLNPLAMLHASFRQPALLWIDPLKEIQASAEAVNNRFSSPQQVIRSRGGNPDDTLKQLADWKKQLDALGLAPAQPDNPQPAQSK